MNLGLVMPVVIQNEATLAMTLGSLRTIKTDHPWSLYVLCNRLAGLTEDDLATKCRQATADERPERVVVINDVERTVSGAWNEGARRALKDGASLVVCMANDVRLSAEAIDAIAVPQDAALWSGCQKHLSTSREVSDGGDFSLFALTARTLAVHGAFDENFRPAYFEDNDYYARVVLGGERCVIVHDATYDHFGGGSRTLNLDAEMAHHVRYWFDANRNYFRRKWGRDPAHNAADVLASYYKTPFDVPHRPLCWWELEAARR